VSKDTIKEALFDALGTGDLEWSQQLAGPHITSCTRSLPISSLS